MLVHMFLLSNVFMLCVFACVWVWVWGCLLSNCLCVSVCLFAMGHDAWNKVIWFDLIWLTSLAYTKHSSRVTSTLHRTLWICILKLQTRNVLWKYCQFHANCRQCWAFRVPSNQSLSLRGPTTACLTVTHDCRLSIQCEPWFCIFTFDIWSWIVSFVWSCT